MALRAMLASPEFLFRIERDPRTFAPDTAYRISDLELASRLSFFLWSSIPDDELLDLAVAGKLQGSGGARGAGAADAGRPPRRRSSPTSRASGCICATWPRRSGRPPVPGFRRQPAPGVPARDRAVLREHRAEDRSVLDLLRANYTFLNERLARHYGIPNVYGSRFRRVTLDEGSVRGGLLGQGSILTVTSYANRTSPVLRGKWILENILGTPPPPPPPNVPPLEDNQAGGQVLSMRERMAQHRANPACASCHQLMDPLGLSLENFDAVGRWRTRSEAGAAIDASGGLPDGTTFEGVAGLRQALLRPAGRVRDDGHREAADLRAGPRRRVLRRAGRPRDRAGRRADDYRFSSLVLGIVKSTPFQMRSKKSIQAKKFAMIITKMALPRRTFLRGMGATLALPLLDAMVPALSAIGQTAAKPVRRLGFVYIPMGMNAAEWTPQGRGADRASSRRRWRRSRRFSITSRSSRNLELRNAYTTGNHATANCAFLSCARAKRTEGQRLRAGHDGRSDRGAAASARTRHSVARARHGPRSPRSATATTATPAST